MKKSSIVTDADFQMDLRMTGQINNVPANFANSVHFLRNANYDYGG